MGVRLGGFIFWCVGLTRAQPFHVCYVSLSRAFMALFEDFGATLAEELCYYMEPCVEFSKFCCVRLKLTALQ